jgi:hypothetical protein
MPQREHGPVRRDVGPSSPATLRSVPTGPVPAHARRPATARGLRPLLLGVATTLAVFALAVALVTVIEVVVDHPLSGGDPGATTLGELIHPRLAHGPAR